MKKLLRTPAAASVNKAGAAQDPESFFNVRAGAGRRNGPEKSPRGKISPSAAYRAEPATRTSIHSGLRHRPAGRRAVSVYVQRILRSSDMRLQLRGLRCGRAHDARRTMVLPEFPQRGTATQALGQAPGSLFWQEGVPMVSIDLSTAECDGHAVVGLYGELDVTDAVGLTVALADIAVCYPNIIIDLTSLEFIDCCGLRALARAREQARRAGGDLLLAAPPRLALQILALSGLADVFSVHASVEQAEVLHAPRWGRKVGEEAVTLALAGAAAPPGRAGAEPQSTLERHPA